MDRSREALSSGNLRDLVIMENLARISSMCVNSLHMMISADKLTDLDYESISNMLSRMSQIAGTTHSLINPGKST